MLILQKFDRIRAIFPFLTHEIFFKKNFQCDFLHNGLFRAVTGFSRESKLVIFLLIAIIIIIRPTVFIEIKEFYAAIVIMALLKKNEMNVNLQKLYMSK